MLNNQITLENNITQDQKINQRNSNIPETNQNDLFNQSYKTNHKSNEERTNKK